MEKSDILDPLVERCSECKIGFGEERMSGTDWSEIPEKLLTRTSKRLQSVNDNLNFSCVCKSSMQASIALDAVPIPKPPLLVLSDYLVDEEEQQDGSSTPTCPRSFLGLTEGGRELVKKVYHLHLPESHQSRCIGMNNKELSEFFINKVVLSSTLKSNNECVAMAIYGHMRFLAFTRLGDPTWTMIEEISNVDDVVFFKGKFYVINWDREFFICDFDSHPYRVTRVVRFTTTEVCACLHYLVQWMGELLVVDRFVTEDLGDHDRIYYRTSSFKVFKIDFATLKCNQVLDLRRYSLFLGFDASVSVLATLFSRFKGNCIYFTDDHLHRYGHFRAERTRTFTEGGHDMGVFDFDNGVIQHISDDIVVFLTS